jgi:cytosine/adenosine deaminase-related metal-dependent hydrolase
MGHYTGKLAIFVLSLGCSSLMAAPDASQPTGVLFENVRIFDGTAKKLSAPANVLVVGNLIQTISTKPITAPAGTTLTRVSGGGRTLMPGLIDNHVHVLLSTTSQAELLQRSRPKCCRSGPRPRRGGRCYAVSRRCATWAGRC